MAQSFLKCEICDKRECALICIDCDQYFCQECKEGHIKTKTTKDHTFLDSQTFQPQYKKLRCTPHEQHFIFFCERCQTLVCPICLPENHQEHRMLKIDEVALIKKKLLNETVNTFVTKLNDFQMEVNSVKTITQECQEENRAVIQHVKDQAKDISNVLENQKRSIIESIRQKAKTEAERISKVEEDLQNCLKEAKEIERKTTFDLHGSDTSLLSNFQLRKSKLDTFAFQDTSISACPVQFPKYIVHKEELSLLESVFIGNLCGLSEHEERNTLENMISKHDRKIKELQQHEEELTNQIKTRTQEQHRLLEQIAEKEQVITNLENITRQQKNTITREEKQKVAAKENEAKDKLQIRNLDYNIKFMLKITEGLPEMIAKIGQWKTQGNTISLPKGCASTPETIKYVKTIELVYNSIIELKNDLLHSQNDLKKESSKIANWTLQVTTDVEKEKRMLLKLIHEKDIILHQYEDTLKAKEDEIRVLKHTKLEKMVTKSSKTLEKENKQIIDQLSEARKEIDCLKQRLSSIADKQLPKGNPGITDLGDPKRPMKISERYGELYDNEWTDALVKVELIKPHFPDLENSELEEIVIRHLYRTLKFCYQECKIISLKQTQTIRQTIAESFNLKIDSENTEPNLPGWKEISFYRKHHGDDFATSLITKCTSQKLCENILENWDYCYKSAMFIEELLKTPFFDKCVHLCWYMAIQEPMMYLDDKLQVQTKYNKSEYKEYVQSGDKVRYIVWPALYLHEKGPLLFKGVVQAYF